MGEKLLGWYSYVLEERGGGKEMGRARKRAVVLKGRYACGLHMASAVASSEHRQLGHSSGTMQMRSEYIPYLSTAEVVTKEDPQAATPC